MIINKVKKLTSANPTPAPKIIKVTRAPKILKATSPEVAKFVSKPLNSGGRKKIQKEMDRILKKIDAAKNPKKNDPHENRRDRYFDGEKTNSVFTLSGGLPGLGKRR